MITENGNPETTYERLRASLQFLRAAHQIHEFCIDLEDYHHASGRRIPEWSVFYKASAESPGTFITGCTIEEVSRKVKEHFGAVYQQQHETAGAGATASN